jgi:hypothetical protein
MSKTIFSKFYMSFFFILLGNLGFSQNLTMINQKSIGGAGVDAQKLFPAANGNGYFLIGQSNSNISGDKTENSRGLFDIWITRLSNNFDVLWDKTIGTDNQDFFQTAILENDKIYISVWTFGGQTGEKTEPSYGSTDSWIICLDTMANIVWQKTYGGNQDDGYPRLVNFSNNSLLFVSQSRSQVSGNKTVPTINGFDDLWLVEINKTNGSIVQQKSVGSAGNNEFPVIIKSTFNNHLYLATSTYDSLSGDKTDPGYGLYDIWLIELDENINIIADKCFGGNGSEEFPTLIQFDNHIFLSNTSNSGTTGNKTSPNFGAQNTRDTWCIRLDHNLNITWDKSFGGLSNEGSGAILENVNQNIILSTGSASPPGGNKTTPHYNSGDAWVLILNPAGDIIHQETFGGAGSESGQMYPHPSSSQKLIFCGSSDSGISGTKTVNTKGSTDTWIGEVDASAYLNIDKIDNPEGYISVYPNPFLNQINFDFTDLNEEVTIRIYSLDGKTVYETTLSNSSSSFVWESEQTAQIFLYEIKGETISHTGRVVKL